MSKMKISLTVRVYSLLNDTHTADLNCHTAVLEYPASEEDLIALLLRAYRETRFIISGGTGHPDNPWNEDQPEPESETPFADYLRAELKKTKGGDTPDA